MKSTGRGIERSSAGSSASSSVSTISSSSAPAGSVSPRAKHGRRSRQASRKERTDFKGNNLLQDGSGAENPETSGIPYRENLLLLLLYHRNSAAGYCKLFTLIAHREKTWYDSRKSSGAGALTPHSTQQDRRGR